MSITLPSIDRDTTFLDRAISFTVCEYVYDLCDAAASIVQDINRRGIDTSGLPSVFILDLAKKTVGDLYPRNMYADNDRLNEFEIRRFDERTSRKSVALVESLYEKFTNPVIIDAVKNKNRDYFIKHFDELVDTPFSLKPIKNMIKCNDMSEDDRDTLWEYLDCICHILNSREEFAQRHSISI